MGDHITSSVYFFAEENWCEPCAHWPEYWFDKHSYSRWATQEILDLLMNRGAKKPTLVVEEFMNMMDNFSCVNQRTKNLFSIARAASRDIYDIVRDLEDK